MSKSIQERLKRLENLYKCICNAPSGGGGGSQTLAETLVNGEVTGGRDIIISNGDAVFLDNGSKLMKGTTDAGLGGNNGIALKCSIDYEFKWEAGILYIMQQDGFTIRESRYNFGINPAVTDDDTKGYVNGSRWIRDGGRTFECTDSTTGSAIWEEVTPIKDLAYTASPTDGTVTTDTTADVTLPLANATNAGLLKPADFTQLSTLATDLGLRTRELLQNFTAYTTTGTLTEQIISNQTITANDMKINSWLNFIATLDRTGVSNATILIYLNTTSNSLSGAVKIATAGITGTQSLPCFKRDFSINASSVLRGLLATASFPTDEISTSTQSTTTLTLGSTYYLITTVVLNNVTDTVTQRAINLKSSK